MSLDSIVSVSITTETSSVSRAGFGMPLIMSCEAKGLAAFAGSTVAKIYTQVTDMVADLFDANGVACAMATAIFSQNPKPPQIVVARRNTLPTPTMAVTVASLQNSVAYALSINGVPFSFTSDGSATIKEIVEGLAALINAGAEPVTATENDVTLTLTADVAGVPFTLSIADSTLLNRQDVTPDAGVAADLATIRLTGNDDWYCALLDTQGKAEIEALAAAIEALLRIFIAASGDSDILTGSSTDLASQLQDSAYARTALIYHPNPHERPDAAWAGKCLPLDPGSETWKFKTLAGVPVYTLSATQRTNATGKGCNVYERIAGNNMTAEGVTASGEFIDITRFVDFIVARIKENVFFRLKNLNKVPFTDSGIALIESEVRGVIQLGIRSGGFAADPAPIITVPLAADVSALDKANRLLPDIRFSATLAGAIHAIEISGVVSV